MKVSNIISIFFISILMSTLAFSQAPEKWTSAEIQDRIKKLNFLGSVLYVAAHPDDENTRLISYMANEKKAETAYLSLTRGDGGQNLIGTEIRELLGVLRTQELLAARRIDGGKQFFTRANDFGYSKHPDETFEIWNKEEVLSDVVMTVRKFQPDIIVNRFDHRSPGRTHGHHTGSAMLGLEAFGMSGDAAVYPEHLDMYKPHQPERIFFNTSWWFYGSRENFEKADKTNMYTADIGVYYPLKGKSNTEIAAESRSMHKCQGFGSTGSRGEQSEYLEFLDGSRPTAKDDVFSGINTSWTRLKGGALIGELVSLVERTFDPTAPYNSVDVLVEIYDEISKLENSVWKERKLEETKALILACSGFYLDVNTRDRSATPGDTVDIEFEIINRSPVNMELKGIEANLANFNPTFDVSLENNNNNIFRSEVVVPKDMEYSTSYWLRKDGTLGMYAVEDKSLIGVPQTPDPIVFDFDLLINNISISVSRPLVFKKRDPVKGEVYDPFEVLPAGFAESKDETVIFKPGQTRTIQVEVTAGRDNLNGVLIPCGDEKWKLSPERIPFELESKNEKAYFDITVTAPDKQDISKMAYIVEVDGESFTDKLVTIQYDHIPTQQVVQDNSFNAICIDIKSVGNKVAYIMGAGDKIPDALRAIGYQVDELSEADIRSEVLNKYQSVIVGIRAYNTIENMKFHHKVLMDFVKQGGNVVIQYNTSRGLKSDELGPYPLKLSRGRVTDETAPVKIIAPDHPIVNYPNMITSADFEGWVQERGLYFPSEWDDAYTPILQSNDPGEEALTGGLLVAKYGNGHFVYTGYSFFRELPAGVPGAYRLFANLISYGQQNRP